MLNNIFKKNEYLIPTYISNLNYKYIEVDNNYFSTIIITDYPHNYPSLLLEDFLEYDQNITISIFLNKKDKYKTIKELTYFIGTNSVNLIDNSSNSQDYNIISFSKNDAQYIRRQIQVNNDELFDFCIYITVKAPNPAFLERELSILKTKLLSKGLNFRIANFRQKEGLLSTTSIGKNPKILSEIASRNILSSSISVLYPFLQTNIIDKDGILYGKDFFNNSPIIINKFDRSKYKNSNTIIFGSSGSGKSFFSKLNVIREWILGRKQYIVDAEKEYINITKKLNGEIIKIGSNNNKYVNILDIYENSYDLNYLENKIHELKSFFYLIFPNINDYEYSLIESSIQKAYEKYNLNFNDDSFILRNDLISGKSFVNTQNMPILEDIYNEMRQFNELKNYCVQLLPFINGSLSFFNKRTNMEISNNLILADISDIGEENYKYGIFLFSKFFWEVIKNGNKATKSLVYIDEIWRLIGTTSNIETAKEIHKMFKTIRKYNAGITAITQDISDLFQLNNGSFGKSIINNSSQKILCNLDLYNIKEISKYIRIYNNEVERLTSLKKGESLIIIEDQHLFCKIVSSSIEKEIIDLEVNNENSYSLR